MADDDLDSPSLLLETEAPRPGRGRLVLRALLVLGVLALGAATMVSLVATRPEAVRHAQPEAPVVVEVVPVSLATRQALIEGSGTVVPARQVVLSAEVAGRVVWLEPALMPGSMHRAGQRLLRIDPRDHELALQQQEAQVSRARTELALEQSRKRVAEREWQVLGEPAPQPGSLALREPQLESAEVAVKAAESGLRRARLGVEKTVITAPFAAVVLNKTVEVGQLVTPGMPLVTLAGTDAFWVQVAVPAAALPWMEIAGIGGASSGSAVEITQQVGAETVRRSGRVLRLTGEVDPVGRMARVLVEVRDPFALGGAQRGLPLLINSFVEVAITGKSLSGAIEIPRAALRGDDTVWLLVGEVLRARRVEVVWRQRQVVLVRGGLVEGDLVVVSPLAAPVEGQRARRAAAPAGAVR